VSPGCVPICLLARSTWSIFINPLERGEIGPDLFRAACRMGLEVLVSKRRDRPYQAGRSKHWIKVKNRQPPAVDRVMEPPGRQRGFRLILRPLHGENSSKRLNQSARPQGLLQVACSLEFGRKLLIGRIGRQDNKRNPFLGEGLSYRRRGAICKRHIQNRSLKILSE
jgi:bifunctional non-homologous end joining protein LigD